MIMRKAFLVAAALLTLHPHVGWAAAPGSSEDVVEKAMNALNQGRVDTFVKAIHPDALKEFRTTVLDVLDATSKRGKEAQLLSSFEGVSNVEELKALDAPRMFAAMI